MGTVLGLVEAGGTATAVARALVRATGRHVEVVTDGAVVESHDTNPLDFIAAYQQRFKAAVPQGLPRFCGGLAGYFGYDTVRHIEPRLARRPDTPSIGTPDILLLQCEELAVIDNLADRLYLIVYADPAQPGAYDRAAARIAELQAQLNAVVPVPPIDALPEAERHPVERHFAKADFEAAVLKCKDYIAAGDCMQVVIGQRLEKRFTASPLSLYRALRSLNPSPYMYYYNFGDFHVVGASPEILVRQESTPEGQKVTIRPLAGTRPRGATHAEDERPLPEPPGPAGIGRGGREGLAGVELREQSPSPAALDRVGFRRGRDELLPGDDRLPGELDAPVGGAECGGDRSERAGERPLDRVEHEQSRRMPGLVVAHGFEHAEVCPTS